MNPGNSIDRRLPFHTVILKMVALTWRTAPRAFTLFVASSLVFTLLLVADLHFVRVLLSRLPEFAAGELEYRAVLTTVLALGSVSILFMIMNGCSNALYEYLERRVAAQMTEEMSRKATRVGLVQFESAELYDTIEKAARGRERSFSAMEAVIFSLIFHGGYFVFLGLYLVWIEPWLVVGVFVSFLPVALSRYIRTSAFYRAENRVAPLRRRLAHYEECMTDRAFLKETRTANAVPFFLGLYGRTLEEYNHEMWRTELRTGVIDIALKVVTLSGYVGMLLLLVHLLLTDAVSAGVFGAVYFAMGNVFKWFDELFGRLGGAHESAAFAGNYFSYLARPERRYGHARLDRTGEVHLDDVTFRYPCTAQDAVAGVSLTIPRGQTLAIVGRNGAGKTTLARLIAGMLVPDRGTIRVGGVAVSDASRESIHLGLSAVFQRFQRYRLTMAENVRISDPDAETRPVHDAMVRADASLPATRLPDGIDTVLSKEFGGTDLSGGEWQRVAVARGVFRTHEAIILDEPTASIDPIDESRLFRRFVDAARDKTAVIVTHRLGSARIADRIIVLDEGRIIEDGTHQELLAADGPYATMYRSQARWYERGGDPRD